MATVADLQVKIGADGSGLTKELTKTQEAVQKAFSVSPINSFSSAVDGAAGKVGTLTGSFTRMAAVAAGGFGLKSIIQDAVEAGDAVYNLTQQYRISSSEAVEMSRVLRMTGGDADTAARMIMRMDKTIASNSDAARKAKATLVAYGVTVTDSTGKLLPLNQQLENLAKGYRKALEDGEGQAFVMNTLGNRGAALAKVLLNYAEAKEKAASVEGIGLSPAEMHEAAMQLKVVELQLGQLKLASGAALAPLTTELLSGVLPQLSSTAHWIKENKKEISEYATMVMRLAVAYEGVKLARSGLTRIQSAWAATAAAPAPTAAVESDLTKGQQQQINKTIAANNRRYEQQRREAIKTAQQEKMSAQETQAFLTQKFTQIGVEAARSAEAIRTNMTAAFRAASAEAERSAVIINGAVNGTSGASAAGAAKIASNERVIASNIEVANSELATGKAAVSAAELKRGAGVTAVTSNEAVIVSNREVAASTTLTGTAAVKSSADTVAAGARVRTGLTETSKAAGLLSAAHTKVGTAATKASAVASSAMSTMGSSISRVTGLVSALIGGWLGVAAAAAYAGYWMYSTNKQAEEYKKEHVYYSNGTAYTVDPDGNVAYRDQKVDYSNAWAPSPQMRYVQPTDAEKEDVLKMHRTAMDIRANSDEIQAGRKAREAMVEGQSELRKMYAEMGLDENDNAIKDKKEKKDDSLAAQFVEALVAAGYDRNFALGYGGNTMMESGGNTEDINPQAENGIGAYGIAQWLDRRDALEAFAVENNSDPSAFATQVAYAIHELQTTEFGNYQQVMADAAASGDFSPGNYARLIDKYIERSEGTEDIRSQKAANAESLAANMSGQFDNKSMASKILERQKAIDAAKKDLADLEADLKSSLMADDGSVFEMGMAKVDAEVKKRQAQIDAIKKVSANIDTANAESLLGQYKEAETKKVFDNWRKNWAQLKVDTAKVNAEVLGSYRALADAEYEHQIMLLGSEKKERLKAVQQSTDDVQALVAVEEEYTAKVKKLQQERNDAIRNSYKQELQYAVERHDLARAKSLLGSSRRTDYENWETQTKAAQTYVNLVQQAGISSKEAMTNLAQDFSGGLSTMFSELGTEINSTGDFVKSFGKLLISTLVKIIAQAIAAKTALAIFGNALGGGMSGGGMSFASSGILGSRSIGPTSGFSGISSMIGGQWMPKVHPFASGGVITAPTLGLLREGSHDEAILPLNSTTYRNLGRSVSQYVDGGKGATPVIHVYNNTGQQAEVTSAGWDDKTGDLVYNITIDKLLSNKNGALSALKQQMGGR